MVILLLATLILGSGCLLLKKVLGTSATQIHY
ncbi:MAG: sortase B protein-sorting domain-containing protein [Pseudohongiellaceae bacterium]